jgi:tetratricopeptide (TPR) repeat protein
MDQAKAQAARTQAFDLNERGRLEEAEALYRAAISHADPRHWDTPTIHGEYASVLAKLHRYEDAARQFERWLELELKQADRDEASPPVVVARYFLGEHYLRMGDPDSARRVAPSLAAADKPLAWLVEAEALYLAGGIEDARAAGERALALALSDEQRERMRDRLSALWER